MKSFPTVVGKDYSFQPPSYDAYNPPTKSSLIFVDGKGSSLDIFMRPTQNAEREKKLLKKLPLPKEDCISEYQKSLDEWYKGINDIKTSVVLPVPMGVAFRRPRPPYIPTESEKDRKSLDYRVAKRSFSVKKTPLYPENYIELHDMMIEGDPITAKFFSEKGPGDVDIPIENHFSKEIPWYSQLIPQRPMPECFTTYEDYAGAMKNWMMKVNETCEVIPPGPRQLMEVLGVKKPTTYIAKKDRKDKGDLSSISAYFKLVSNPYNEEENSLFVPHEETVPTEHILLGSLNLAPPSACETSKSSSFTYTAPKDEDSLSVHLSYIMNEYLDNVGNEEPIEEPNLDDIKLCKSIYDEWTQYGPTKPFKDKSLAKETFFNKTVPISPPYPDIVSIHKFDVLCNDLKGDGARLELYKEVISYLDDKVMRDSIVTDFDTLFSVYKILHEFSDAIHDVPILNYDEPDNILITTFFYTVINSYITKQLADFEESINNKSAATFFKERMVIQETTLQDILSAAGDSIFDCIIQYVDQYPGYITQLVIMLLSIGNMTTNPTTNKSFDLMLFMIKLADCSPETFLILSNFIMLSSVISSRVIEYISCLEYNPDDVIHCTNKKFIALLSTILVNDYPANMVDFDLGWTLLYCTKIVCNKLIIPETERDLFYAIIVFNSKRIKENIKSSKWSYFIPQLMMPMLENIPKIMDYCTKITMLKALRRLASFKQVYEIISENIEEFLVNVCMFIDSNVVELSISGIKTLKYYMRNYSSLISTIAGSKNLLELVGGALFVRNEVELIEIFLLIRDVYNSPDFSWIKGKFRKILLKAHFRIGAARNTVRSKARGKDYQKFRNFIIFLSKNLNLATFLVTIDTALASNY